MDVPLWPDPDCSVCGATHPHGTECPTVTDARSRESAARIAAAADRRDAVRRDPAESQARKDRGQARALANPEMERWRRAFREQVIRLAMGGDLFTSEDVLAVVGLPTGEVGQHRDNAVGAQMTAMHRQGYIRRVTYAQSERPESHRAVLAVWRGAL